MKFRISEEENDKIEETRKINLAAWKQNAYQQRFCVSPGRPELG